MDVKMNTPLLSALAAKALAAHAPQGVATPQGTGFSSALTDALKAVSDTQKQAQSLQRQFQVDSDSVSIEETMAAMQKSQIAFQAALTVRNRLVSAYTDIMNMQV